MPKINLFNPSFPQQWNFIRDPCKLKAIFCTRRAAKSFTAGLYMVYEAIQNPGCNILFIGLTRDTAKNIVWKNILKVLNRQHKLNAKFNQADLTMTLPNGSTIKITGVDTDEDEMNKLLGGKYRLVCIDEASMYTIDVRNLVYGILKPAVNDPNAKGDRGTIILTGTASNFPRGLFYDITTGKEPGWSLHTWTTHDNPYQAPTWQEELDEIKLQRPLYMETPQYRQWYLNQWTVDETKLVYKFDESRNLYNKMPQHLKADGFTFVLGIDLGWEDDNAFVLTCFHEFDPNMYVLKTFNAPKMTFDQVVEKIQEFMRDPHCAPSKIIIDGSAKQGVESMRIRSAIPFEFADKQGKVDFIEILNADLIQAKIKIHSSCKVLINQMMSLVWKTEGDKIILPKKEHPSLPNHLCDALLYAWRNTYHYHSSAQPVVIPTGSPEWYKKQSEDIWERERTHLEDQANKGGWPSDDSGWGQF
jgi:phage terminase large subunit